MNVDLLFFGYSDTNFSTHRVVEDIPPDKIAETIYKVDEESFTELYAVYSANVGSLKSLDFRKIRDQYQNELDEAEQRALYERLKLKYGQ